MQNNRFIIPSSILGLSLLISVLVFSLNWKSIKRENQTITVTGSAKKEIKADLGILRGTLSAYQSSQKATAEKIDSQKPVLLEYLKSKGLKVKKLLSKPLISTRNTNTLTVIKVEL